MADNANTYDLESGRKIGSKGPSYRAEEETVTLSPEQFEMLYLQPREPGKDYPLERSFGNPTALGVSSFLFVHTPLAMDLLNFQGATSSSSTAMIGGFFACGGIGLYVACIMEWVMGNTFPCVVFGTYAGFWVSYAMLIQPSQGIAASFAPASDASNSISAAAAGMTTASYNLGLGMYFLIWGIFCFIYFLCALRVNVPFSVVFFTVTFAFEFIAAAYFQTAKGNIAAATLDYKLAGGFALVTALAGLYIDLSLILASVNHRLVVPLFDLSTRFLVPKAARLPKSA